MSNTRKKKKILLASMSLVTLGAAILLGVSTLNDDFANSQLYAANQNNGVYELSLDSSNSVGTSGTHSITSKTGGSVKFIYTSVSSSSGNHTCLSSGGTIINKDIIHSIESFNATFTGHLQARIGYGESSMGEYFDLVSGQTLNFATLPYFLELKAASQTLLKSAKYTYTCETNPAGEETLITGSYDIAFKHNTSDATQELGDEEFLEQITNGSEYVSGLSSKSKAYAGVSGIKLGSSKAVGYVEFDLDSSKVSEKISSITINSAAYGSDSTTLDVYINDSFDTVGENIPVGSGQVIALSEPINISNIQIQSVGKRCYIDGVSFNYESGHSPEAPVDEVGFTADDNNKTKYDTESIFDNENALVVRAVKSDGSTTILDKNQYSYIVKGPDGNAIDTSTKFGTEGSYSLYVSYKNYLPLKIDFEVGEYVYMIDVAASINKVSYVTADTFSTYMSGLKAVVSYSDTSSKEISYTAEGFLEAGLEVCLANPKGIDVEFTKPFGQAGTWKVIVKSINDENIQDTIDITVAAIPVTSITLDHTELNMYPEDTAKLVATVNPTTATNPSVKWESNNTSVATVDNEGLVTAISAGSATITAIAIDGSNVYGSCVVTVTEKPAVQDIDDELNNGNTVNQTTNNYTDWTASNISSNAVYEGRSAGEHTTIQLRTKNSDSGIVTSTSGGKIKKITVEWYSGTTSGRVLDIYAKNSAYSSPSDLFGNNSGTKIGSITYGSGTEFTVTGDYDYVGVRSNNGALYLNSITFTWSAEAPAPATPIYPTSLTLTGTTPISIGQTTLLQVGYVPSETNVKNVTFTSSDSNVASVDVNGLVTGVSAGTATITATAVSANGTISKTIDITVKAIAVTSVSLDTSAITVQVGKSQTLVATVSPTNATNKELIWSTSDSSIATVNNGAVKGVSAGTAIITVKTVDGNKTASATVAVKASSVSSEWQLVTDASSLASGDVIVLASSDNGVVNGNISSQIMSSISSTFTSDKTAIEELSEDAVQLTLGGEEGAWTLANDDGQLLGATAVKKLAWGSGTTTWTISISGGNATISSTNSSYGRFLYNSGSPRFTTYTSNTTASMTLPQIYRGGIAEPINPTSITLDKTTVEVAQGGSTTLKVSYNPKNANQNKDVTWTSSNTNVATVSGGTVNVKESASIGATATITAKLTNLPAITASCVVTVTEKKANDHTVLIYICGADLESKNQLATGDIEEILKISGQPEDVNIVIETGGASSWSSKYGISSSNLERWHVENKNIVRDASLTYASMGLTSTFQSFLEYGLKNYPANRTGVVLWNHGGGMRGVCYDEKKNDDVLKASEVYNAVGGALSNCGMSGQKLEWIGYDACLMQVQDIAEKNSKYFNYMIASEESEAGYGWDYDTWVDDLYSKKSTETILKAIVDGFISDNGGASSSSGDQTLSYLTLSYASAYKTAWENMAAQLLNKVTTSNRSSFNSMITGSVKHFADSDYDYFCTFDAKDFVNKLAANSTFNPGSSYTNAVLEAFDNLVTYSVAQKGAGKAYGLCMYWCNSDEYSDMDTYYTTSETNFTNWRTLNSKYGYHA